MNRKVTKSVIENGTIARPDWIDVIAISSIQLSGRTSAWSPTIDVDDSSASDLSGETVNVYPIVSCNRAWEIYNTSNVLQTTELFTDFIGAPGTYNFMAWETLAIPLIVHIYKGTTQKDLIWIYNDGEITHPQGEIINPTIDSSLGAGVWNEKKGVIKFSHDVSYEIAKTEQTIAIDETLTLLDETALHNVAGNRTKFYIKELGCYVVNTGSEIGVNFEQLEADSLIKKSEILSIAKVIEPITHYQGQTKPERRFIVITTKDGLSLSIEMGEVWNKPTWVNTDAGLTIALGEINSWIF
jgi:hypothetical protein